MLRTVVSAFAVALLASAVVLTIAFPIEWPALAGASLFALGCLYERRYHRGDAGGLAGFVATPERFADPETGVAMTVWADPRTGERRYVAADAPPPSGGW